MALAMSLAVAASAAGAECPPTERDGNLLRQGDLTLVWRPVVGGDSPAKRIPMAKHFSLDIQLCDRSGASSADLTKVDATMPAHRHGMNYRAVIKPLGGGRFRVDGMMFHMAGTWQLAFEVRANKETLRLNHDVQVD